MPRYHFNVCDGRSLIDVEGTELCDWQHARQQAILLTAEILAGEADCFASGEEWKLEVTDTTGLILLRLDFNIREAAAVSSAHHPHSGSMAAV